MEGNEWFKSHRKEVGFPLFLSCCLHCFVHFVTVASIGLLIVTEKTETHTLLSGNSQPQGRGRALMSYNRDMLKVVRQEMNLQEVTGRTSEK